MGVFFFFLPFPFPPRCCARRYLSSAGQERVLSVSGARRCQPFDGAIIKIYFISPESARTKRRTIPYTAATVVTDILLYYYYYYCRCCCCVILLYLYISVYTTAGNMYYYRTNNNTACVVPLHRRVRRILCFHGTPVSPPAETARGGWKREKTSGSRRRRRSKNNNKNGTI